MTQDNWIKAFDEILSDCSEEIGMGPKKEAKLKAFISQVEKDAIEKTKRETQKEIFDALDKLDMPKPLMAIVKDSIGVIGPELKGLSPLLDDKSESYTNGFRDGFDAGVEKTNKRWREKITKLGKSYYILGVASTAVDGDADPNSDYNKGYKDGANSKDKQWIDKLSDLLDQYPS